MKRQPFPRAGRMTNIVLWSLFGVVVCATAGGAWYSGYQAAFARTLKHRKDEMLSSPEARMGSFKAGVALTFVAAEHEAIDPALNTTPPPDPSLTMSAFAPPAMVAADPAPATTPEPATVAAAPATPTVASALTAPSAPPTVEPLGVGGGDGLIRWSAARLYTYAAIISVDRGNKTDWIRLFLTYERMPEAEAGLSFPGDKMPGDRRIAFQVHGHYGQESILSEERGRDAAVRTSQANNLPFGSTDGEVLLDVDGSLVRSRGGFMVDDVVGNPIDLVFEKPPQQGAANWEWTVAGAIPRQSLFPARGQSNQQKYQIVVVVPSRYRYSSSRTRMRNAQAVLVPQPAAPATAAVGTEPSTAQTTYSITASDDRQATIAKALQVSVGAAGAVPVMTAVGSGSVIVDRASGAPYSSKLAYSVKHHQGSVSLEVPVAIEYFLHHISDSTAPDAADVELASLLQACLASKDDQLARAAMIALADCTTVDSLRAAIIETLHQRIQQAPERSASQEVRALAHWADATTIPLLKELASKGNALTASTVSSALKRIKDPSSISLLVELLKTSKDGKHSFASALRDIGSPALEPLLSLLSETDPEIIKLVCNALDSIYRNSPVTEEKLREFSKHTDARVRKLALEIAYNKSMIGRVAAIFQASLRDPDFEVRERADELLKRANIQPEIVIAGRNAPPAASPEPKKPTGTAPASPGPVASQRPAIDEKELDKLILAIKKNIASRDLSKQMDGYRRLEEIEPTQRHRDDISKLLLKVIFDKDNNMKSSAGRLLEKWATKQNIPQLIKLVESNDFSTSNYALDALGELRDPSAAPALVAALGGNFGFKAQEALKKIGLPGEAALIAGLSNPSSKIRREVIEVLGEVGGAASLKVLPPFLNDPDSSSKYAAEQSLRKINERVGGKNG